MKLYSEKQYKQYCEFCSEIANGTISSGLMTYLDLDDWKIEQKLSFEAMQQMDERMEKEFIAEIKQEKRSYLHIVK